MVIATEWPEFAGIDLGAAAAAMAGTLVVDARNLLDPAAVAAAGLDYRGIGR
jgi:UDPglucose 6-dehydrogenase